MKMFWILALAAALAAGCGKNPSGNAPAHLHEAVPPHGGTPLALNDDCQIEWVLDAPNHKLQAFFLDGEMENFVRISANSFLVTAGGKTLFFRAVANNATGETVGDTSLFEAQADWLKTNVSFNGVVQEVTVHDATFKNAHFTFPKGNAPDAGAAK
jgi:hypothetical protein